MDNQESILTTKFGQYRFIQTDDGAQTIYSEVFDEAAHSLSGAFEETDHNYIHGCKVLKKLTYNRSLNIFEVGFGAGIGLKRTIFLSERWVKGKVINFTSCEIDPILALHFLKLVIGPKVKIQKKSDRITANIQLKNHYQIEVLTGDIRLNENKIPSNIDCLYQDAYSVKKNPSLWTLQWFEVLRSKTNDSGILATYSTSASVQKTLLTSGWQIRLRPGFGSKRTCLVALKNGSTDENIVQKLKSENIKVLIDESESISSK